MNTATAASLAVALVCLATLGVGSVGLRLSRTTSDFYVASRAVRPLSNASAISGEYLSGASFLGVAGLVLTFGTGSLWYPIGYTAGYVVLLALVAAPLRRSGAYTLSDFAEIRLRSQRVRQVCSILVLGIGWLYLLPQFQGAGLALSTMTGAPRWAGAALVAVVVVVNVVAGGMRSVTMVQAFQFWLKLTAISLPAVLLVGVWMAHGAPAPPSAGVGAGAAAGAPGQTDWGGVLVEGAGGAHPVYRTYSLLLALLFGTMGLPHVLVRFYANPDGRAARRTTMLVIGLLGVFYLFPPVYGELGQLYAPDLLASGRSDAVVLLLPSRMLPPGPAALAAALLTAGAFAAFLATSSGLTVSLAGVISQDLLRGRLRGGVAGFRIGTGVAVLLPALASFFTVRTSLADTVSLAFAVAASTFCPLLVLGIWWRGLTRAGALAGLVVGGTLASAAVLLTMTGAVTEGLAATLLARPAAWSVPLSFAVMVTVSWLTHSTPSGVHRVMVRLHAPERLVLNRGDPRPRH